MSKPLVIDLGIGRFQIGGTPDELPPRWHFYPCRHDQPIGADVPQSDKSPEPILTIVFHNSEAMLAVQEALRRTGSWFPRDSWRS